MVASTARIQCLLDFSFEPLLNNSKMTHLPTAEEAATELAAPITQTTRPDAVSHNQVCMRTSPSRIQLLRRSQVVAIAP
jgi:hypothetical protein